MTDTAPLGGPDLIEHLYGPIARQEFQHAPDSSKAHLIAYAQRLGALNAEDFVTVTETAILDSAIVGRYRGNFAAEHCKATMCSSEARRPTPKQAELLSEIDAGLITSSKLEGGWRNARRDPSFANVAPAAEAVIRHGWAEPTNPAGKLRVLRLTATGRARPRRTPHPVTRHGDHAMTTTTPAPVTDITSLLPIGRVAEVTTWDAGTQTRITGTVTGYARDGRRLPRLRPIAGVWVGDSWVSTEEALAPETRARLCGPGEAAVPLTNAGVLVTLEDTRPGDVLYVAFPAGDSVVQALGPVDAVDPDGQWVGLDGEMTLSTGVPFFAIRRVTAAEQREAQ